ncbi:MAG: hypothetical protein Q9222_004985 [Ikaeria aurantiellina]
MSCERYIVRSTPTFFWYQLTVISALNNLFTSYYTALQYSTSQTDLIIQNVVSTIDKIKTESPLKDLLSALTAGLALLGAPGVGSSILEATVGSTVKSAAQVFTIGVQQAPGVAKALWPQGTLESQLIQIGETNSELARSNEQLSDRLTAALELLMTDVPTFLSLAGTGLWTTSRTLSIPAQTKYLTNALHNYVTSQVLARNGWYGIIEPDTLADPNMYPSIESVEQSGSRFGPKGVRCDHSTSICTSNEADATTYLWSNASHRIFSLISPDFPDYDHRAGKMTTDIVNNQWADLEVLLDGSFNCTFQGRHGSDVVGLGPNGALDLSCLSQLPIQGPRNGCYPGSYLVDGKTCPFQPPPE